LVEETYERRTAGNTGNRNQLAQGIDAPLFTRSEGFGRQNLLHHEDTANAQAEQN
jgi:hypothetical protein